MRLVLVTNNRLPPREGVARHVLETGRRLARRGHAVTLLGRGDRPSERVADGLRLVLRHIPALGPLGQLADYAWLRRWLAEHAGETDLVHAHLPLLPPLPAAPRLVATVHSPMLADAAAIREPGARALLLKLQARLVSRRLEAWHLRHAERLVAVSRGVRGELVRDYAVAPGRIEVVPNGVDTDAFPFAAGGREPFVLYVGRLGYRKGLPRLLDAFARLKDRPGLGLVLAGEGPLQPLLARRATDLGIADRVHLVGFQDRDPLLALLHAAACLVNPADYESGPLTLLEAMAAGTPVVSTPTGLARELGPEPPLLLARPEAASLASAIAECLADPAASASRARRARALVEREYAWERVVDRLETLYGIRERAAA